MKWHLAAAQYLLAHLLAVSCSPPDTALSLRKGTGSHRSIRLGKGWRGNKQVPGCNWSQHPPVTIETGPQSSTQRRKQGGKPWSPKLGSRKEQRQNQEWRQHLGQRLKLESEAEMGLLLIDSRVAVLRLNLGTSPSLPFHCHNLVLSNLQWTCPEWETASSWRYRCEQTFYHKRL